MKNTKKIESETAKAKGKAVITRWRRRELIEPNAYEFVMNGKLVLGRVWPSGSGGLSMRADTLGFDQPSNRVFYGPNEFVLPPDFDTELPRIGFIGKVQSLAENIDGDGDVPANMHASEMCRELADLADRNPDAKTPELAVEAVRDRVREAVEAIEQWEAEEGMDGEGDTCLPELKEAAEEYLASLGMKQ